MIKIPYYENSYFALSNFSPHQIIIDGVIYTTLEHAYQTLKFEDKNIQLEIQNAKSPMDAFKLGRKYKPQRKANWDEVKVSVMFNLLKEKVFQHEEVREILIKTGSEEIVEDSPNDYFWGCGLDGKGQNNSGKLLMKLREELRKP